MPFNSYEFLFAFLPITLSVFFAIGRFSRPWALRWIIIASLFFYAWWRPFNVLLIAPSILINFGLARALQRAQSSSSELLARTLLIGGVCFNVAFLGYFKYSNFFVGTVNDVFGTNFIFAKVVLPLGISFITFQKIAFLIDIGAKRVKSFTFQDYCLFVLFFPQLIVGPIVHYREVMPQFEQADCRWNARNVATGVTLLAFGLCKKAFLADSISPMVGAVYGEAAAGGAISLFYAWLAAVGFTLQIYFDFSGYSDMAIGAARCFGIKLPVNFNSPLRSTSVVDFWGRWHITLSRFLTAYLYNPLTLWLTRRRIARGLKGFGGANTTLGSFLQLLAFPTILTMCVSGLWHGAGYTYVFWGLLFGAYLTINHAWQWLARGLRRNRDRYESVMKPVGFALTFTAVVVAMVFFRAPSMRAAWDILAGMVGLHGAALPPTIFHDLGRVGGTLHQLRVGIGRPDETFSLFVRWSGALLVLALVFPNTLQMLARFEPALCFDSRDPYRTGPRLALYWRPSAVWAALLAVITVLGVLRLGGVSEFLYWQF